MPHVSYLAAFLLCPWPGCGYRIALLDFQLELSGNPQLYARAVQQWGSQPPYGLVGRCPGCRNYVWYGETEKRAVPEPVPTGLDVLPDDWHLNAFLSPS
jgi:hypothetical protein